VPFHRTPDLHCDGPHREEHHHHVHHHPKKPEIRSRGFWEILLSFFRF
jgi:hypothetical protein